MTFALILLGVVLLLLTWLFLAGRSGASEPTAHRRLTEDIDYTELEQAEREVQEACDEESVRDWGPGAQKPPLA